VPFNEGFTERSGKGETRKKTSKTDLSGEKRQRKSRKIGRGRRIKWAACARLKKRKGEKLPEELKKIQRLEESSKKAETERQRDNKNL